MKACCRFIFRKVTGTRQLLFDLRDAPPTHPSPGEARTARVCPGPYGPIHRACPRPRQAANDKARELGWIV